MVFVRYSQNIRRHNAIRRKWTCWGRQLQFSSWFSIRLILHRLYRFYYQINSIYKCVIIESNVFHRSVSNWESLSFKTFLYSLPKHKWIETQLWRRNFNPMFSITHATSYPPIALWRRMFWQWTTNDVYFQSCQLMYHGLMQLFLLFRDTPKRYIHYTSSATVYLCIRKTFQSNI